MALLMKESNEILSSVYRATPNLFHRFMPQLQAMHNPMANILPLHIPGREEEINSEDEDQESPPINHHHHNNHHNHHHNHSYSRGRMVQGTSSPALSPNTAELSIDQNCTPPSSSSSTNSTVTSVSPLDFNSFVTAATASSRDR